MALNLVKNLASSRMYTKDNVIRDSELIILGNPYNKEDFNIKDIKFICVKNFNPLNKFHCLKWELFAVSIACKKLKADRVIYPRGFCALTHPVKDIVITLDMIPFYYHENYHDYFNKIENAYIMNRLRASAKSCHMILTISEESKRQIIKYCKVKENKINVTYVGCNDVKLKCEKKHVEQPYICAMTSKLPHKNAVGIFEVYKKYCEITKNPLFLKVIGVDGFMGVNMPKDIRKRIECYKYFDSDQEMHQLISGAEVFMFLSLAEGFGFPPLEAMQMGVPVICSNRSSLPEVTGNAAVLVNPEEYGSVAREIKKLVESDSLREELIRLGYENIKRFLWNDVVQRYWKCIMN